MVPHLPMLIHAALTHHAARPNKMGSKFALDIVY
jgi:hypothetical protein